MKYLVVFVLLAVLVIIFAATLTHSYIGTAVYDTIESMSFQQANDQIQARGQNQAEWKLQQTERELKVSERQQISGAIVNGWNTFLPWVFGIGSVCLCMVFLSTARAVAGISEAAATRAQLVSRQIPMDPETGSFPLLISEDGKYLLDINSYASMEIGREYQPQLQFVDRANRLRRLTIIGYSTAHSTKGGPEIIFPALEEKYE